MPGHLLLGIYSGILLDPLYRFNTPQRAVKIFEHLFQSDRIEGIEATKRID